MDVLRWAVGVMMDVLWWQYEKTAWAVYAVEDSVATLVDLMSIYRDKGGAIFTRCCMLLAILGSDTQRKAVSNSHYDHDDKEDNNNNNNNDDDDDDDDDDDNKEDLCSAPSSTLRGSAKRFT